MLTWTSRIRNKNEPMRIYIQHGRVIGEGPSLEEVMPDKEFKKELGEYFMAMVTELVINGYLDESLLTRVKSHVDDFFEELATVPEMETFKPIFDKYEARWLDD